MSTYRVGEFNEKFSVIIVNAFATDITCSIIFKGCSRLYIFTMFYIIHAFNLCAQNLIAISTLAVYLIW